MQKNLLVGDCSGKRNGGNVSIYSIGNSGLYRNGIYVLSIKIQSKTTKFGTLLKVVDERTRA